MGRRRWWRRRVPINNIIGGWTEHGAHQTLPTAELVVSTNGLTVVVTHEPGACVWKQRRGEDASRPSIVKYSMVAWQSSFQCCPCLRGRATWMPPRLLRPPRRSKMDKMRLRACQLRLGGGSCSCSACCRILCWCVLLHVGGFHLGEHMLR
jgi:hypothetical protein